MFHQAAYNTTLAFTFCLSKASRSARGEKLGPSQTFPGEVHSSAHVHGLLDPQEYVGVFQRPLWTSHSLALKKFFLWSASCLSHLLSLPQAASMLNYCCWLFLTNAPEKRLFTLSWVRSNKNKLWEWRFSGTFQKGQMTTLWGQDFFRALQALLLPLVAATLRVFKASAELGQGEWDRVT